MTPFQVVYTATSSASASTRSVGSAQYDFTISLCDGARGMRRCAAAGVYTCARDDVRERYVSEAGASSYVPMAMRGMSRGAQELSMYGATMRAGLCAGAWYVARSTCGGSTPSLTACREAAGAFAILGTGCGAFDTSRTVCVCGVRWAMEFAVRTDGGWRVCVYCHWVWWVVVPGGAVPAMCGALAAGGCVEAPTMSCGAAAGAACAAGRPCVVLRCSGAPV